MTKSKKQNLLLFSIFLLLASAFFSLEGQGALGWKTGMATLLLAAMTAVDYYLVKSKAFRFLFAVFCLLFLFLSINNFLAH